jgi:hypothetical protein
MELLGSTIALDDPSVAETASPFDSLKQSAALEFHAAIQLLAERAAFLTAADGVGIAVTEESKFVYCVANGDGVPASGSIVDRLPNGGIGSHLVVPINSSEGIISGFFELASKQKFRDQDSKEITRLADLASVAVEHRQAAERAGSQTWEELQQALAPVEWHAPASTTQTSNSQEPSSQKVAGQVKSCSACGFPVSPGRALCVECELKSDAPVVAASEPFSLPNQESLISEHGYTVASVIVSALAAAVILWLRR